jgi:hypothetical protein
MKMGFAIFLVLFVTYAYFPQKYDNANVVSRMALTLSILEDGTLTINEFRRDTIDVARHKGNYYSDKAPGMAFSALPIAALTRLGLRTIGLDGPLMDSGEVTETFGIIVYVSTVFTSGLMTAITALALYFLALQLGSSTAGAIFAMLVYGFATPAWGWASAFFGHATASACLFLGFAGTFLLVHGEVKPQREIWLGFLTGAVLSWAVVVEFTTLPAVIIIASYGLISARRWELRRIVSRFISALTGATLSSIPLFLYNAIAFESPFLVGYKYVTGFAGMNEGLFGFTYPKIDILYRLLFSQYRGILWYAPILISAPIAYYSLWRTVKYRRLATVLSLIPLYYLLMNASYYYWDGGWSTGPRHLTPMLPFLILPLAILWSRTHATLKPILLGLFFLSFEIAFISAAVDVTSPSNFNNPLFEYLIPEFVKGNIRPTRIVKSLNAHESLIPMLLLWVLGYFFTRGLFVRSKNTR